MSSTDPVRYPGGWERNVALVRNAPCSMAYVENGRVRYANKAFRSLFGCSENEDLALDELKVSTRVSTHALSELQALVSKVSATGEGVLEHEITSVLADTVQVIWTVTAWRIDDSDRPVVAVMIRDADDDDRVQAERRATVQQLRDVNEQLLLATLREEDLRVQAEAASYAKSVFVATMSHELRTPLAAILGYGELLHNGLTGPVTEAQQRQLGRIIASANHLLAIINEILTLASVESQHETLNVEQVEIHQLVESTTSLIAPLVQAKGLDFKVDLPEDDLYINTDVLKVRQILVNLLGNAVKFTESGSIEFMVRPNGENLTFQVKDSGIGIAPPDAGKVFDAFWQVRSSPTARRFGGSGLGLNVSQKLARLMNGDVEVESELGAGSTFRLVLPKACVSR